MDGIDQALEVLGLGPNATPEDIKQAYRDLAKVWHPDRFPTDSRVRQMAEEKLKEINWAYEQLRGYQPTSRAHPRTSGGPTARTKPAQDQGETWTPKEESSSARSEPPMQEDSAPKPQPSLRVPRWAYIVGAIVAVRLVTSLMNQSGTQEDRRHVTLAPRAPSATRPSSPPTVRPQLPAPDRSASAGRAGSSTGDGNVQPTISSAVIPVPKSTLPEQLGVAPGSFTVGSSKDEVLAVQGTPTEFNDRVWKYGLTSVNFSNGRVTSWDISPLNPIKVQMLPSAPVETQRPYFMVGSTKDEVLAVQGTPTEFNDRVWKYGLTSVNFSNGRVTTWDISPLNPIKVRMLPSAPVETHRSYFTVGSTKDEVLAVQGTPTEFNDQVWKYGLTSVYFSSGRVTSWDASPLNPIRARLTAGKTR